MSTLLGIARFRFKPGRREEYLRLTEQAAALVKANEPGTLRYEVYLNADQTECMIVEEYRDSQAAMDHARNIGPMFADVLATVDIIHGELLGEPNDELRANLTDGQPPILFTPFVAK